MSIHATIQDLNSYGNLRVDHEKLVFDNGILNRLKHFFNPSYHNSQVKKVVNFFNKAIASSEGCSKHEIVTLANAFIVRSGSDQRVAKILREFDRQLLDLREIPVYVHPENKLQIGKWIRASQPTEIFQKFPEFAEFLNQSKLLSQLKVTRDSLQIMDGEPAMLVNGNWMKATELMATFHIEDSPLYNTRFVTHRSTGKVYTYLDNRKGLQQYHPFQTVGEIPISVLEEDETAKVQEMGNKFVRDDEKHLSQPERDKLNQNRPFVLQLVTSYTNRGTSNFAETMLNPRHAYLRFVAGADLPEYNVHKGDVFEFAFGWKWGVIFPMEATQGLFCSLDPWEYVTCDKRIVTCASLSAREAAEGFKFAILQQNKQAQLGREVGFQLAEQNCTVFTRKDAECTGISIPTEIGLKPLLYRILPDSIKRLGSGMSAFTENATILAKKTIRTYTPTLIAEGTIRSVEKIYKIYSTVLDALAAFVLLPIRTLLGGWLGNGGESFDEGEAIVAPSRNLRNWFDLSSYRYNLPVVLQEWQKAQPSTFVVENPVRLAIVPS